MSNESGPYEKEHQKQILALRFELENLNADLNKDRIFYEKQRALRNIEIENLKAQLKIAVETLNKLLIKIDWNADDFRPEQYHDTRKICCEALERLKGKR